MSIPAIDLFYLRFVVKDAYGKILSSTSSPYYGMIEREQQLRGGSGGAVVIGQGMVFSDQIENGKE